ncbi:MAG: DUF2148 domain-containing protein [Desulfurococcaceae archaeon]
MLIVSSGVSELSEEDLIREAVLLAAKLMAISAKTAPKARGVDNVLTRIVYDREELEALASKMEELASKYSDFFIRDARNVRDSTAVLLIGCKFVDIGFNKLIEELGVTENFILNLINLGIAIGSAVKTASMLNVDNRVMFTVGVAAKELGLLKADVVIGIPLSATSKNIFFDRVWAPIVQK